MAKKQSIVILGAGFAGLRTALLLEKKFHNHPTVEMTLVDERDSHVYSPDLYEIATAYNKKLTQECLTKLKDTVATPFEKILAGKKIHHIRDRVTAIHPREKKTTLLHGGKLDYDILAVCLGSVTNYYGIPGLTDFSYPLKTLTDALAICCHLDIFFHNLWREKREKNIAVVVGGGGATGVEFACELPGYLDKICEKYHYPREKISVSVIEGSNQLAGQGTRATTRVLARFKELGIQAHCNCAIIKVTEKNIRVRSANEEKEFPMDILIWTGGVQPHPLIRETFEKISPEAVAKNGALTVTPFLQSKVFPEIFAAGDNAFCADPASGKPAPMLAQIAFDQAGIMAHNIAATVFEKNKKSYRPHLKGVIIPLGGKYAILKKNHTVIAGFWMWVLRRLVDLAYFLRILPFPYAVKKWIHDTNIFVGND